MRTEHHASLNSPGAPRPIPFFPKLFATGLFTGYIPGPAGTWGSVLGAACFFLLPGTELPSVLLPLVTALFFAGVYSSRVVAERTGHRLTKSAEFAKSTFQPGAHAIADPSIVVIDEFVGMWASMLFLPKNVPAVILVFCLFRLYDIVKPFPARQLERIPHGWGIMLDDLVAAVYANISAQILLMSTHVLFPRMLGGGTP